ncbi:nucleotide exchange factor GrpE [Actinoallomurus sp. CA-142502]|uniref:nucleotide exchange factor GrpE n=1 Tax=Actinoallomurus sp. CA-142502 TaxID=3239885 RepID=UPI003D8A6C31
MAPMKDTGPVPEEPRAWPRDPGGETAPQADDRGEGAWPQEAGASEPEARAGPDTETPGPEEPESAPAQDDHAAKISELEDRWRRALADLDNFRKRTVRALQEERDAERARTTARWLPVLDDLERALDHADAEPGAVIQGVRAVLDQARDVIARLGYPRQEDMGARFDPARHHAVTVVPSDAPDGTVVRVLAPGYGEGARQLRPAQVLVAKGRPEGRP